MYVKAQRGTLPVEDELSKALVLLIGNKSRRSFPARRASLDFDSQIWERRMLTVYGQVAIEEFEKKHAQAREPPARFLILALDAEWKHFPAVKETFPATDYLAGTGTLIFDIGGNKYRLVARVDFEEQTLFIQAVMTHSEYNREKL